MATKESVYVQYDGTETKTKMLVEALNHNTKDTLHDPISINRRYEDPLESDINLGIVEGLNLEFVSSNYRTEGSLGTEAYLISDNAITIYESKEAIEYVSDYYTHPRKYLLFDLGMRGIPFTGYYKIEFDVVFSNPQPFEKNRNKMLGVMFCYSPFVNGTPTSMQPGSVPRTNIVLSEPEVFGTYYNNQSFPYYAGSSARIETTVYSYQSFYRDVQSGNVTHYSCDVKMTKNGYIPRLAIVIDDFIDGHEYNPLSQKNILFRIRNITTNFLGGKPLDIQTAECFYKDKWVPMRNPGSDVFSGQQIPTADFGKNGDVFFELGEFYPYIDSSEKLDTLSPYITPDRWISSIYGDIFSYNDDKTYIPISKTVTFSFTGFNVRNKQRVVDVQSGPGLITTNNNIFVNIELENLPTQTEIRVSFDMQLSIIPVFDTYDAIVRRHPETTFYSSFNDTYLDLYYTQGMHVYDSLGGYDSVLTASGNSISFTANTNISTSENVVIDLSSISNCIYIEDRDTTGEGYNSLQDLQNKVPVGDISYSYIVKGEVEGTFVAYYYYNNQYTTTPRPNFNYSLSISGFNVEFIRTYENVLYKYNNTWLSEDESSGGTTVIANPSGTAMADLNKLQVGQDIYRVGGTTVIGNPSGTASTDLEKIQIGSTIYGIPSGGSGNVNDVLLDGVSALDQYGNANINSMVGAGSSSGGTKGLVPTPSAGDNTKFLAGDGTWKNPLASLSSLNDVVISTPSEGQVLRYDSSNSKWKNSNDSRIFYGTTIPSNSVGADGDLYYQYHETANGWTADSEYLVTDAGTVFDICDGRTYSKTNNGKAIAINYVSSSWSGGMLVSQEQLACYYSNQGGSVTTTNSTVIDGTTWYISTPGGWKTGAHYNTNDVAPDIEFNYSTQGPSEASIIIPIILEAANAHNVSVIDGIISTFFKKDGTWIKDESGGTTVVANPSDTPTGVLSSVGIGDSVYSVGGSDVEANPSDAATDTLSKLRVGNVVYNVPSGGGGGSGSGYTETTLFTGSHTVTNGEITLSDNLNNYDQIVIWARWSVTSTEWAAPFFIDRAYFVSRCPYDEGRTTQTSPHVGLTPYDNQYIRVKCGSSNNKLFLFDSHSIAIEKVTGIKYGGGGSTVAINPLLSDGVAIATITINGTEYTLYAPEGGSSGGGEMPEIIEYAEINKLKNKSGEFIGGRGDFEEYELISDPADNN